MDSFLNRIDKFQKLKSGSHSKSQVTRIIIILFSVSLEFSS
ncbi:hypothetical protein HanLR1_Chr17g0651711 [Helianthus annuus]|nr:hypothetical protein HanLR1_Chr17g0651711 [Helianthus annuus]